MSTTKDPGWAARELKRVARDIGDKQLAYGKPRYLERERQAVKAMQEKMESLGNVVQTSDTGMPGQGPWGPYTGAATPVTQQHHDSVVAAKLDVLATLLRALLAAETEVDRQMLVKVAITGTETAKGTTEAVLALAAEQAKTNKLLEEIAEGLRLTVDS